MRVRKPAELVIAGGVILAFGIVKLVTLKYIPKNQIDTLLLISTVNAAWVSALVEILIASAILFSKSVKFACYLTVGTGLLMVGARYLYIVDGGELAGCPCLGGVPGILPAIRFYSGNILITTALWITMLGMSSLFKTEQSVQCRL